MTKKSTHEEIIYLLKENGYFLINNDEINIEYKKGFFFCKAIDKYGYKYYIKYQDIKNKKQPSRMGKNNLYTLENISLWLKLNNKDFVLCDDNPYKGNKKMLKFFHSLCEEYFYANWNNISNGHNCGVCDGRQVGEKNSLAYLKPDLVGEWSDKNKISSTEVSAYSGKIVIWKCKTCNHEWKARISNRTKRLSGCPACAGFVVSDRNRLSIIYPKVASEWHPIKNGDLTSQDVCYGTHRKVWWLCGKCGNEWKSTIHNRTIANTGCPLCAIEKLESKVATECKNYFKDNYDAISEYKVLRNPKTNYWLKCDIYIPNRKIFIEINGGQHYKFIPYFHGTIEKFKENNKMDEMKKKYAKENGIYIEIDLRKFKTVEIAIKYIENILK